jgi:hypothetical protein
MRLFTLKLLFVSIVATALMLAGAGAALADTGNQNPNYTVAVNIEPDIASVGDAVTAYYAVANNTGSWKFTKLCLSLKVDDGDASNLCKYVVLPPSKTLSLSYSFILPYSVPGTTVTVGLSASDSNGTSSASDSITLS